MSEELVEVKSGILSGTYTGNGTTQKIVTNFQPKSVRIVDWSEDGDITVYKDAYMPDGEAIFEKTVGSALKRAKILIEGITIDADGFTIGTSVYVNADGHTFHWEAF